MTKKHFEYAAAYCRDLRKITLPSTHAEIVRAFTDVFAEFNPRFDTARFTAACNGQNATDSAGRTVHYG
jgi:hypothetical protein